MTQGKDATISMSFYGSGDGTYVYIDEDEVPNWNPRLTTDKFVSYSIAILTLDLPEYSTITLSKYSD